MSDGDNTKESEESVLSSLGGQPSLRPAPWRRKKGLLSFLTTLSLIGLFLFGGNWLVHGQVAKTTDHQNVNAVAGVANGADMTREQVAAQALPAVVSIDT